jgi:hypothetical protein
MESLRHALVGSILFAALVSGVNAQDLNAQDAKPHPAAAPPETTHSVLTGKERLGRKWTDEQRIDNCNVPIDKRGRKPRPDACSDAPPS